MYIAHEGVTTTDLFRRQGNMTDVAFILGEFSAGHVVNFNKYNFYTLASVVKVSQRETPKVNPVLF